VNPDQIALVKESFAVVQPHLDDVATRYYADLFRNHPELRTLFTGTASDRRTKFVAEFSALVEVLDTLGALVTSATELGAQHAESGVLPENYEYFGESLRRALGEVLGDRYDADVDTAWRLAYNLVAETMVHGATHTTDEVMGYARLGGRLRT